MSADFEPFMMLVTQDLLNGELGKSHVDAEVAELVTDACDLALADYNHKMRPLVRDTCKLCPEKFMQ